MGSTLTRAAATITRTVGQMIRGPEDPQTKAVNDYKRGIISKEEMDQRLREWR